MENRKHRRFRLQAFVSFSWEPVNGGGGHGEGYTRDISLSSAYIVTSSRLPLGTVLRMIVTLPALQGAGRGAQLSIEARTVRMDANGIAVTGDMGFHLEFQDSQQKAAAAQKNETKTKEDALRFFPGLQTLSS